MLLDMVVGMYAIKLHHNCNNFDLKDGRFPDTGSYESWVTLYHKVRYLCLHARVFSSAKFSLFIPFVQIQVATQQDSFEARGSLKFIPKWKPVLTNPALQLAQESMTGWKEVHNQTCKTITNSLINFRQVILVTNCGLDVSFYSFCKDKVLELIGFNRSWILSGWHSIPCVGQSIQIPNQ